MDKEIENFLNQVARLAEISNSYCVIAELPDSKKIIFKVSNKNWAVGAVHQFLAEADEIARHEMRVQMNRSE